MPAPTFLSQFLAYRNCYIESSSLGDMSYAAGLSGVEQFAQACASRPTCLAFQVLLGATHRRLLGGRDCETGLGKRRAGRVTGRLVTA